MKIAFNTANLVARASGYKFSLSKWMDSHYLTVEKTDDQEWAKICKEIADCGYTAAEVWLAHIDPSAIKEKDARRRLRIMHDHGISPIGLAGGLTREAAEIMAAMGISTANGGFPKENLETIQSLCEEYDLYANYENHPEKTVGEILDRIGGGSDRIGVAIDSGWLGSQDLDAPTAIRELGPLVRHIHVKDVLAAGAHETCVLGEGSVDLTGMFAELKKTGYTGWYSWEDEPEDRNPFESAIANRQWIEKILAD